MLSRRVSSPPSPLQAGTSLWAAWSCHWSSCWLSRSRGGRPSQQSTWPMRLPPQPTSCTWRRRRQAGTPAPPQRLSRRRPRRRRAPRRRQRQKRGCKARWGMARRQQRPTRPQGPAASPQPRQPRRWLTPCATPPPTCQRQQGQRTEQQPAWSSTPHPAQSLLRAALKQVQPGRASWTAARRRGSRLRRQRSSSRARTAQSARRAHSPTGGGGWRLTLKSPARPRAAWRSLWGQPSARWTQVLLTCRQAVSCGSCGSAAGTLF